MWQMILDIRPDAPASFDNYLPGDNGEAVGALRDWAEDRARERILYLWGDTGTGKSHLLAAARSACLARGGACRTLAPGCEWPETGPGLLLVDDVQGLDADHQVALFNLINQAREGQGRIVACGNAPPAALPLRADLRTRLAWGLVFRLAPLSDADKLAALGSRARARGMALPDDIGRHLLVHCRRDLPHLLALVDGLDEFSLSRKRPLTLPLAREYLRDLA